MIDPMPIADGQYSSRSSVVGDDVEKVQKTSSRHELKLSDSAAMTRSSGGRLENQTRGALRESDSRSSDLHLRAKRRNEQMRGKAVAISSLRPFATAASHIATKRNPKADVHAPEEV